MKRFSAFFSISCVLLSWLFTTACGTPGSPNGGGGGTGSFSNASLKGSYVYHLNGQDLTNNAAPYAEEGVFTADGNGNITAGTDDYSEATSGASNTTITGTYTVSNDGTGTIGLNYASGGSATLALTVVSPSTVYLIEGDTSANATGLAELQDPTAIAAAPNGTYVFRIHTTSGQGSSATAGVMTIANGVVSGGNIDVNRAGAASSLTLSAGGLFNVPGSAPSYGRGTGTFSDSSGTTLSFVYYIVDSNHLRFLMSTPGINGLGHAEMQTGAPFTGSPLSGSYAFGTRADDSFSIGGVATVGSLTSSGSTLTGGYDSVADGNSTVAGSLNGTVSSSSNGRVALTFAPASGVTVNQVAWMVSSSHGYLITLSDSSDPSKVEDGTVDLQQSSSFSSASLNAQYAFVMGGLNLSQSILVDRVGWIQFNGSGTLSLYEDVNDSGSGGQVAGPLPGTYAVASNGRGTATVSSLSASNNDLVFYLISGNDAYILQNDTGLEISGRLSLQ